MADVVDKQTRSRMMSGIRGKNTRPEIKLRKALHKLGFRFRLHDKRLPGSPDIVLRIFANFRSAGCQGRYPASAEQELSEFPSVCALPRI